MDQSPVIGLSLKIKFKLNYYSCGAIKIQGSNKDL